MSQGVRMSLEQLPPHLRAQAEMKLGLAPQRPSTGTLIKAPPPETATKTIRKVRQTLTPDRADSLVKAVKVSDDGNEVKIVLAISPNELPTAQQKGAMAFIGKDGKAHTRFYTKSKIAKAEKALIEAISPHKHLTENFVGLPLECGIDFYFPFPTSTPKKNLHKIAPHMERPDTDNCAKLCLDCITQAGFWTDDSVVVNLLLRKRRTTQTPCIVIKIRNLQPQFEALYRDTEEHDSPTLFNQSKPSPKPSETNPLAALQAGQSDDQTPLKEN